MRVDQVDDVLRSLTPGLGGWGWSAELPEGCGRFLGHRLGMEVCTRLTPGEGPPPPPSRAETELLRAILTDLPDVLAQAESHYHEYEAKYPDSCEGLYGPHVSVSRGELAECGSHRWALILRSRYGAPDWNLHIEFERTAFRWIGQANEE